MNEKIRLQVCVLISNMFVLAAFIMLAIVFNKWWIVILSLLFFNYVKNTARMWCDGCGETIYGSTKDEVSAEAKRRGWKKIKREDQFLDACPKCYDAMLKKERAESTVIKDG